MTMQPVSAQRPLFYVRIEQFEARIGRDFMIACFDENNDGSPDPGPVWQHLIDSETYVEGFLKAADYDIEVCRQKGNALADVVKLILDHAEARVYVRHPETARYDGDKALARVRIDCLDLQAKRTRIDLNVGDPAPAGVGGGTGRIGIQIQRPCPMFSDLGDFPGGDFG